MASCLGERVQVGCEREECDCQDGAGSTPGQLSRGTDRVAPSGAMARCSDFGKACYYKCRRERKSMTLELECVDCAGPRSQFSGQRCRACWTRRCAPNKALRECRIAMAAIRRKVGAQWFYEAPQRQQPQAQYQYQYQYQVQSQKPHGPTTISTAHSAVSRPARKKRATS